VDRVDPEKKPEVSLKSGQGQQYNHSARFAIAGKKNYDPVIEPASMV
jgi:hypothetical protein